MTKARQGKSEKQGSTVPAATNEQSTAPVEAEEDLTLLRELTLRKSIFIFAYTEHLLRLATLYPGFLEKPCAELFDFADLQAHKMMETALLALPARCVELVTQRVNSTKDVSNIHKEGMPIPSREWLYNHQFRKQLYIVYYAEHLTRLAKLHPGCLEKPCEDLFDFADEQLIEQWGSRIRALPDADAEAYAGLAFQRANLTPDTLPVQNEGMRSQEEDKRQKQAQGQDDPAFKGRPLTAVELGETSDQTGLAPALALIELPRSFDYSKPPVIEESARRDKRPADNRKLRGWLQRDLDPDGLTDMLNQGVKPEVDRTREVMYQAQQPVIKVLQEMLDGLCGHSCATFEDNQRTYQQLLSEVKAAGLFLEYESETSTWVRIELDFVEDSQSETGVFRPRRLGEPGKKSSVTWPKLRVNSPFAPPATSSW